MVTEKTYNARIILRSENSGQLSFEKINPAYSDENAVDFVNSLSSVLDAAFLSDEIKVLREFHTAITKEEEVE